MAKIPNDVKKKATSVLRSYVGNRAKLRDWLADAATDSPLPPDGMPRGSGTTSDPTLGTLLRFCDRDHVKEVYSECTAVERALFNIRGNIELVASKQAMVKMIYFDGSCTPALAAEKLYCDVRTIQRWQEEILRLVAMELGII